jgi:hypothetical protein
MKQIKTIDELLNVIRSLQRNDIFQEINGKKYKFHIVLLLQTPLGELMQKVKEGLLYYDITA